MGSFLYFHQETEKLVMFKNDEINSKTFYEDILRIGLVKNGIEANDLFKKLNEEEIDSLLISLQYDQENIINNFYNCVKDESEYYLTVTNSLIEKVKIIGKNSNCTLVKLIGDRKGIFMASNSFIEKNLIRGNQNG